MPQNHVKAGELSSEVISALMDAHTDITGAVDVEIAFDEKHGVVWLNVNGVCVTRICRISSPIRVEKR
jgi:hypothetical protein